MTHDHTAQQIVKTLRDTRMLFFNHSTHLLNKEEYLVVFGLKFLCFCLLLEMMLRRIIFER